MRRGLYGEHISQHKLAKIHYGFTAISHTSWKHANKIAKRARKHYTKIRRFK